MRARHVLRHQPPHSANRLPPSLPATSGGLTPRRGRGAHVPFGHASLRTCPDNGLEGDAELLREPPHQRCRAHLPVAAARRGRRRRPRLNLRAVRSDHDQNGPDRHDLALGDEDLRDGSSRRRGDLDRRLVGLDLDQRIVLRDLLALAHEPARDLALGQPLAQVGQPELVRHRA